MTLAQLLALDPAAMWDALPRERQLAIVVPLLLSEFANVVAEDDGTDDSNSDRETAAGIEHAAFDEAVKAVEAASDPSRSVTASGLVGCATASSACRPGSSSHSSIAFASAASCPSTDVADPLLPGQPRSRPLSPQGIGMQTNTPSQPGRDPEWAAYRGQIVEAADAVGAQMNGCGIDALRLLRSARRGVRRPVGEWEHCEAAGKPQEGWTINGRLWVDGLPWEHIAPEWTMTKRTTKTGA